MSEEGIPNVLQSALRLMCRIIDGLNDLMGSLGDDPAFRAAFLAELGLPVNALDGEDLTGVFKSPCDGALLTYVDAVNPDLQAFESAIQDLLTYLNAIGAVIDRVVATHSVGLTVEEIVNQLFEIAITNHVKYRHPHFYQLMRLIGFIYYDFRVQLLERFDPYRFVELFDDPSAYGKRWLAELETMYDNLRMTDVPQAPVIGDCGVPDPPAVDPDLEPHLSRLIFVLSDLYALLPFIFFPKKHVLSMYYSWEAQAGSPTPIGDRIESRFVTLQVGNKDEEEDADTVGGSAILTMGLVPGNIEVPKIGKVPGLWIALGGALEFNVEFGDGPSVWVLKVRIAAPAALNLLLAYKDVHTIGEVTGELAVEIERKVKSAGAAAVLPANTGTRLEFGELKGTFELNKDGGKIEFEMAESALVIATGDGDYFTSKVMTAHEYRVNFNLGIGLDFDHGVYLIGGAGLSATIPIGKTIAGVTLQTIQLGLALAPKDGFAQIDVLASAAASIKLGGLVATLDGIGFNLGLAISQSKGKLPPNADPLVSSLGYMGAGFNAPNGIGLVVSSKTVTGGGFLFHDKTSGQYAGVLQLQIGDRSLSAAGLVSPLPGSNIGYSLLVTGSLLGLNWPLVLGFRLTGLGILLGANRTVSVDALRAGLKNHTLDLILFPAHPVADAPRIVGALAAVFPPSPGQFLIGIAARIEWGTNVDAAANLEVILEAPSPLRIVLLGSFKVNFPRGEGKPRVRFNMDVVGVLDFDRGELSLDASLSDSHILDVSVSGDMALRMRWKGQRDFLLAVGGFHPRFTPPPAFPQLQRIMFQMNELDGSLTMRFTAYFAITSNSLQLGADFQVHLGFLGFSIDGDLGFDILLQDEPPELTAGLHGSVSLRFLGETFASAGFDATYTGWHPQQHIEGEVTFKVWIFHKSKHFSKSFGESAPPQQLPAVDPLHDLLAALSDPGNWRVELPSGQPLVAMHDGVRPGQVHPQGVLAVRQQVVPLEIEIDRYGRGRPSGTRRFRIDGLALGGVPQSTQPVEEFFAAGQFLDLSDDERLSRDSFEPYAAGVSLKDGNLTFGGQAAGTQNQMATTDLDYETCIIQPDGECFHEPQPHRPLIQIVTVMAERGAAAQSQLRTSGDGVRRVDVKPVQFTIAGVESLSAAGEPAAGSFTEAAQELRRRQRANPALAGKTQVLANFLVEEELA